MPAYISHAIMGESLYEEALKEGNIFNLEIKKEEIKGYSLGADFSYLSKRVTGDPHNSHTQEFFLTMIHYIKQNRLTDNKHIMALLYGHIAHYFLDTQTHPLIYYLESGCKQTGLISNHDLIEGYLSAYLSRIILNRDIMEIKPEYFNQINLSESEIQSMINYVYGKIYKDHQMINSYQQVRILFTILEIFIKRSHIPKKFLLLVSQFATFLNQNNLTRSDLTNENHETYTNPVTGEKHTESFIDLYNQSIDLSLEAIFEANKYLYGISPISSLEKIFTNLSYDTGISCSLGRKMTYVRKRMIQFQKIILKP